MTLLELLDEVKLPPYYNLNNATIKEILNPMTDVKRVRYLVQTLKLIEEKSDE